MMLGHARAHMCKSPKGGQVHQQPRTDLQVGRACQALPSNDTDIDRFAIHVSIFSSLRAVLAEQATVGERLWQPVQLIAVSES